MEMPVELKPALWGIAGGAAALAIVGFTWGGWVTANTSNINARSMANQAVVSALAPICAEKFRQQTNASANLVELKKVNSWQQGDYVEKGGWATLPGNEKPDSSVARACAEILNSPKL